MQAIKKALARRTWWAVPMWTLTLAASLVFVYGLTAYIHVDYGFWGILIPVFAALPDYKEGEAPVCFRHLSRLPVKLAFCTLGVLLLCISRGLTTNLQSWCLMALPILALYNGQPGHKGFKYGFYVFYPAHLAVIYLLKTLLEAAG